MELIDTHCHIQSIGASKGERHTIELWNKAEGLSGDRAMANAKEQGVSKLICVGCDLDDSLMAIDFAALRDGCYASIGIHPHESNVFANNSALAEHFESLASKPKVVAVGECGLDYFYEHSPKDSQLKALRYQIEIAIKYELPLIFHVRQAFKDFWPVFDEYKGLRGVLHSFTDDEINLEKALSRNLYIGVNGISTFTKDKKQLQVYKAIPLSHLLLETDSPYLTPAPYRGTINEPMRVGVVADFLSNLRHEKRSDLAGVTTKNAVELFRI
jgi:TatD DNase family protein